MRKIQRELQQKVTKEQAIAAESKEEATKAKKEVEIVKKSLKETESKVKFQEFSFIHCCHE